MMCRHPVTWATSGKGSGHTFLAVLAWDGQPATARTIGRIFGPSGPLERQPSAACSHYTFRRVPVPGRERAQTCFFLE